MQQLSIITINYNNVAGLAHTLESVRREQQRFPLQYIVVDGGSQDGSKDLITSYQDCIDRWVSEPDNGVFHAMNKGVQMAKGEYLMFLNSGDWLVEGVMERIFSRPQQADILYGQFHLTRNGKTLRTLSYPKVLTMAFFAYSSINHQSMLIKRSLQLRHPYNEQLRIVADWEFLIKTIVLENCSAEYLGFPFCYFDGDGLSGKGEHEARHHREREQVLRELLPAHLPPRIAADYQFIDQVRHLKLPKYLQQIAGKSRRVDKLLEKTLSLLARLQA